jgi:hypothetical protein
MVVAKPSSKTATKSSLLKKLSFAKITQPLDLSNMSGFLLEISNILAL